MSIGGVQIDGMAMGAVNIKVAGGGPTTNPKGPLGMPLQVVFRGPLG
jgi:hypothetical protein